MSSVRQASTFTQQGEALRGMVLIPAGGFLMGSEDGGEAERPQRRIELPAFWMDRTPVSNGDYALFVAATGYVTEAETRGSGWGLQAGRYGWVEGLSWHSFATHERAEHPVVLVSWNDASAFAAWAGKQLPTEAQWERVARGPSGECTYPWGEREPDSSHCAWNGQAGDAPATRPVGSYPANQFGAADLVGNVWQWCRDVYRPFYDSTRCLDAASDPPPSETLRARRGGAWNVIQSFRLRCANRGAMDASASAPNVGFRCVANVEFE